MSKYTTQVRFICETLAGYDESQGLSKVQEIIDDTWDKLFDFDFPIFDEEYRSVLCKKIIKHYYTREIGYETVGLWKLKLDTVMNEIMPYFNQMYSSTLLEWNPLYDADYTKSHEGENEGDGTDRNTGTVNGTSNSNESSTTWDVYSDTPQGALTNVDNNTYLTNARKLTQSGNRAVADSTTNNLTLTREYSNTDEYLEHVQGKFPGRSYSSLIKEYRETFLNIDMDVINSLSDLFMRIW